MPTRTTDSVALKRAAAAKALEFVTPGMKLGLGTGSTAEAFLDLLGPRVRGGFNFIRVATSEQTAQKARAPGLSLSKHEEAPPLHPNDERPHRARRKFALHQGARR